MSNTKFKATWCTWALKRGGSKSWLPRVQGRPAIGDLVEVVRKDGSSETVKVVKILWSGKSKYDDSVQSIVDFTDPEDPLPSPAENVPLRANTAISSGFQAKPVESSTDGFSNAVRLPNGAVLTISYQAPLEDSAVADPAEDPPAGDSEVDGGIPF